MLLTLKLDFVLDNKSLALVVNLFGEFGRDSVMGRCVLDNKTLITFHASENSRLLRGPLTNVCPFFLSVGALSIFLSMRSLPS